jgi:hypothetical protein
MTDGVRRFPAPWSLQEGEDQCFRIYDANGFFICSVKHRDDLHRRSFQYADGHLCREEARRIAKAISRLPDLLKRPPYYRPGCGGPVKNAIR